MGTAILGTPHLKENNNALLKLLLYGTEIIITFLKTQQRQ